MTEDSTLSISGSISGVEAQPPTPPVTLPVPAGTEALQVTEAASASPSAHEPRAADPYAKCHHVDHTLVLVMGVPWVQARVRNVAAILKEVPCGHPVWDENRDAMDTWRKVLAAAGERPVIILEDDITLTDNWRHKAETVIGEYPHDVIQFFSLRGRTDATLGSRWEPGRTFMMNQCYYLPEGVAAELLEYSYGWSNGHPEHPTGYDITMANWMQETGRLYRLHVPSLVQHKDWRSEINPRRPVTRQSPSFKPKD